MSSEQEHQHREKWKLWNQQREKQQIKKKMNVQEGMQNYAVNLIQKMSQPLDNFINKEMNKINKKITNQIQSNICSICLELMIPPERHPIILFPCGHNLCKECLFQHPPKGLIKKNIPLRLKNCSLCRQKIQSYALNQSLMALICTYSNNKELLQKEKRRLEEEDSQDQPETDIEQLRIRCNILQKQQKKLRLQTQSYTTEKTVLGQVIDTLKKEKKNNEKQMEKLQEEASLITKCLSQKLQDMQMVQKKIKQVRDKERVLDKALGPLKKEKEKQQLLEIARIVSKK